MTKTICSVVVCDRPVDSYGYCYPHYMRWKRNGTPGESAIQPRRTGCEVEGCNAKHNANGYCRTHVYRLRVNGDPLVTRPRTRGFGELCNGWLGDAVQYQAVHARLRRMHGPAKDLTCFGCEGQACDWAYQHTAGADEQVCPNTGLPFTTDLSHYRPMCSTCHNQLDALNGRMRPARWGKGTSFDKRRNKWRAYATVNGKQLTAGYHQTQDLANTAAAALRARLLDDWLDAKA